jgi:mannosylglucosylglycerate synthase
MLSIANLHFAGPPTVGGVEITIAHHARVLRDMGYAARVVVGRGGPFLDGVEVLIEPLLYGGHPEVAAVTAELNRGYAGPAFESLTSRLVDRLAQALAGVDIAIVHNVLSLHKNLCFTAALHRLHHAGIGPRLLAWCHDFAWRDPLYAHELYDDYPWNLLRKPWPGVRYVVVSEDRLGELAGLLGLPEAQIEVVTPGVDLPGIYKLEPDTQALVAQLGLLDADPLLLLPARITRRKNIEQAIAIAGALRRHTSRPLLLVSGPPGPHNPTNAAYLAQLQDLQASSGAGDAVVFLYARYTEPDGGPRPVSDAVMADLYQLADGLLFPSRYEGFGIPIIEAGLLGLPIFCSDIAPFRETAGDAAVYFPLDGDPDAVAAAIAAHYAASPRYALRRKVRRGYTWEAIVHRKIVPLLEPQPAKEEGEA